MRTSAAKPTTMPTSRRLAPEFSPSSKLPVSRTRRRRKPIPSKKESVIPTSYSTVAEPSTIMINRKSRTGGARTPPCYFLDLLYQPDENYHPDPTPHVYPGSPLRGSHGTLRDRQTNLSLAGWLPSYY